MDGSTVTLNLPGLILNDPVGEPNESFSIAFTNPSAGLVLSRASHAVTITFDGDPVGVKILDLAATEGNGPGNTTASVVVQLNYPIPPLTPAVTVNYTTTNGSATSGADYVTTAGVLSFAVGESTKTIAVPIMGDTCPEPSKAFFVDLTGVSAAGILEDNQATVSLLDNDFSGTFQLSAPRLTVSESGPKAQVTVVRTGGLAGGAANCVGFSLTTQDGTATSSAPADFTAIGSRPLLLRRRRHQPGGGGAHRQRHPGRARGVVRGEAQQPHRPGGRAGRPADLGGGHHRQRHRGRPAVLHLDRDGGGGRGHGHPHGDPHRGEHRPAHRRRPGRGKQHGHATAWTSPPRPSSPSMPTSRACPWW